MKSAKVGVHAMGLHLTEEMFPEVPVRQWVCSLPWQLRHVLGYDRVLCAAFVQRVDSARRD